MSEEYVYENPEALQPGLDRLTRALKAAEEEAQRARALHVDLKGPIRAAEADAAQLRERIADLRKIQAAVAQGYPYVEERGFEEAVDACGEVASWEQLAAVPTPGTVLGRDDTVVRLPAEVQENYAHALSAHLFDEFLVCYCFEPRDDGVDILGAAVRRYLFGAWQGSYPVSESRALFLIAQWREDLNAEQPVTRG